MFILDINMKEIKELLKITKTILIPYGSIEEHGHHLPLGTDSYIVIEVLKKIQEIKKVFIAPPIFYGVCTSTKQHLGTITITPSALRIITRDIIKSFYNNGFRTFLLVSGHGGGIHINAIREVGEELLYELEDAKIAVFCIYEIIKQDILDIVETKNDSHAGEIETSLMLSIEPSFVKGRAEEEYPSFPKPILVKDKIKYWKNGVWGNPNKATMEKGERIFKVMVKNIIKIIKEMER